MHLTQTAVDAATLEANGTETAVAAATQTEVAVVTAEAVTDLPDTGAGSGPTGGGNTPYSLIGILLAMSALLFIGSRRRRTYE